MTENLEKVVEQFDSDFYRMRFSDVDTMIIMDDDGKWHVTVTMTQGRKHTEQEEWDTREEKFEAEDFDIDSALTDATLKGNFYLDGIGWDLFGLPEKKEDEEIS